MRNPAKGYHGPTRGIYILIVEQYPTEQDAARRAREYRDNYGERVGDPEQKSTVRCWAQTDGTRVYLLTTHAAMYIALEELTHGIQTRLTKYLREQPTPR